MTSLAPDELCLPDWEDHANRFVEAVALGQIADEIFAAECRRRGIPADDFLLLSPLDSLKTPSTGGGNACH